MRSPRRESDGGADRPDQAADKLRCNIEQGVPFLYFTEAKERQRRRWVDMGARALAPWRVDNTDGRAPHREPHQETPYEWIGQCSLDRGGRMLEYRCEREGRDHKNTQTGAFDQVFRPVVFENRHRY